MSEDAFNMSTRKFLKKVGVTSQHEIEEHVRQGKARGGTLRMRMTLTSDDGGLSHVVEGEIELP